MNVVLDTAEEVYIKSGNRKTIGESSSDYLPMYYCCPDLSDVHLFRHVHCLL